MNAAEIIREIETLSPAEQAKVVKFAYQLDAKRKLSGDELSALADRMTKTSDPTEAATLRSSILQGFYGVTPNG